MAIKSETYRRLLPRFLSPAECMELEFIHRSCGVVGYRPHVLSTTLSHLVATNCAHLMIPLLPVRERLKEAVEGAFGREYDLFVEFTGLISWTKGANIGWHSDNNRPYLRQRDYAAVCYLNEYDQDFKGGIFRFQEGQPAAIIPRQGTALIYTADEMNMHSVDEVTSGERSTLALWFTSNDQHNEDPKLIRLLSATPPQLDIGFNARGGPWAEDKGGSRKLSLKQNFPRARAASSLMYSLKDFHVDSGLVPKKEILDSSLVPMVDGNLEDLRTLRVKSVGFDCHPTSTSFDDQDDCPSELAFEGVKVPAAFSSSLEALQVVEFHRWRRNLKEGWASRFGEPASEESQCETWTESRQVDSHVGSSARCYIDTDMDAGPAVSDHYLKHGLLGGCSSERSTARHPFNAEGESSEMVASKEVDELMASFEQFDVYSSGLSDKLMELIPVWTSTGVLELLE